MVIEVLAIPAGLWVGWADVQSCCTKTLQADIMHKPSHIFHLKAKSGIFFYFGPILTCLGMLVTNKYPKKVLVLVQ